ncbi:hypothetical protein L1987_05408 [Smallanthus sonchifolius]|uniref:Uncharacterized protein n=1 Tax=Smallanthus sonchifolius TaxID=185202 RepID=A0ACB9JV91_9ASTR|nr:hypothetical protein L1987_05408 [Smallanthus sonchifolius]
MASYAPSKLILVFLVSLILSNSSSSVALNQTTNIRVIINEDSRAGKEQKTAIEIAVRKLNSVGTDTWEETRVVAKIGQRAKIPVISLTADALQPLSPLQWPFLVQMTNLDMSDEIKCIASIVQSYNWKRVIVVYEDNMYDGEYRAISLLSEALQKIGSFIDHSVVVPHFTSPFDPKETIRESLVDVLTTKQSRVFIVLKSSLQAATRVFKEANKLGLMGRDSVWILGDSLSSFLDSLDPSVLQLMQGALGVKTYYSEKSKQFLDFKIPKGWAMPSNAKKMKIGVPDATSFDRFVKVKWIASTNKTEYSGFCIKVFESVVTVLEEKYGYMLPYEFTNHTGSYDDMVDQFYNKKYDAVVGDVTILANRSRYVEFTQPFIESGLSMVVPVFPKDSPIADDVSGAILSLLEDGKIRDIENEWLVLPKTAPVPIPGWKQKGLASLTFGEYSSSRDSLQH